MGLQQCISMIMDFSLLLLRCAALRRTVVMEEVMVGWMSGCGTMNRDKGLCMSGDLSTCGVECVTNRAEVYTPWTAKNMPDAAKMAGRHALLWEGKFTTDLIASK